MTTPVSLIIEGEDRSQGAFNSAGNSLTKIGQIAAGILTSQVFTKLAQGVLNFAKSTLTSAMESEEALANLNATIQSTGGVAGVTADMANDLANSLQNVTRFSDETILNTQSMLLTFTKIGKEVFPDATEAALNMAAKFKTDPTQAAIQLGKALNEPIEGVAALRRVGVQLTDDQEKQIKRFMQLGDVASAQKIILGELNTEFGGLARAMGQTFAGRMDIFKNKLDNIKETIGMALIPVLESLMSKFEPFIPVIENFAGRISEAFAALSRGGIKGLIANLFGADAVRQFNLMTMNVREFVSNGLEVLSQWWADNGPGIMSAAQQMFTGIQRALQNMSATAGPFMEQTFGKIVEWFIANGPLIQQYVQVIADVFTNFLLPAIVTVWNTIQPLLGGLVDLILGLARTFMQVVTGDFAGAWETLKATGTAVFEALVNAAMNLISGLLSIFGTSVPEIAASLVNGFEGIKSALSQKISDIVTAIRNKLSAFRAAGVQIVTAIRAGVQNAWNSFVDWVVSMVQSIIDDILASIGVDTGGGGSSGSGAGGTSNQTVQNYNTSTQSAFFNFGTYNSGGGSRGFGNMVDQFG